MHNRVFQYAMTLVLLARLGGCAAGPAARLGDAEMLKLAEHAARGESAKAKVGLAQSSHPNLGTWQTVSPLAEYEVYCAWLRETPTAPEREFMAVRRDGAVIRRVDAAKWGTWVAAEDRSGWTDEDFMHAATMYVHLQTTFNEDGWRVVDSPGDFMGIGFNMPPEGPAAARRGEAARQIVPHKVERNGGQVKVTFYAWQLIGGRLCRWEVVIGPKVEGKGTEIGRFGGAMYD